MSIEMFPVNHFGDIEKAPENYRLLQRVPLTQGDATFPFRLSEPVGDEVSAVVLDLETTGLDSETDSIIELGMARVKISESTGCVVEVTEVLSVYEDPGIPVPAFITEITGITSNMVAGQKIDDDLVARWLGGDEIIVAHNAQFDRGFFEKRWPSLSGKRWACSSRGIDWRSLGFESSKLEYLVFRNGHYFYEGHRASIDCLAVVWLLHVNQAASKALLDSEKALEYSIKAIGAPFDVKDSLKSRGYAWKPEVWGKVWRTVVKDSELAEEKAFLAALYHHGDQRSEITPLDSRSRYIKG